MKKSKMLRDLLKKPGLLIVPGVYDCLTAGCAEEVGFKAVFMCTAGVRNAEFGFSVGIITATEAINSVRNMMNSIHVPVIFDAEVGFGGPLDAYRTVQDLIRIGVSGISLNDQKHPYRGSPRCRYLGSALKEVISRVEFLNKMEAVLEARNKMDKDVLIVSRIEAGSTLGDEEVVERAKACLTLGVDVVLPQARPPQSTFGVRTKDEIRQLYRLIGAPEALIWAIGGYGVAADFAAKDWEEIGAKIWAPGPLNAAVKKLVRDLLQDVHDNGTVDGYTPRGVHEQQFLHKPGTADLWEDLEQRYVG